MKFTLRRLAARKRWLLDYRLNGKQHRLVFKTKDLAEAEQERIETQITDGGTAWLALSTSERIELMAVAREIQQAGKTLRGVWEEYKRRTMGAKIVDKKLGDAYPRSRRWPNGKVLHQGKRDPRKAGTLHGWLKNRSTFSLERPTLCNPKR